MNSSISIISRYESKYVISETEAQKIRDYIQVTCSPDRNVDPDGRYTVNNLYFETPELRFYYDTKFKRFNRFKPRVRFYGQNPSNFLWLELKHKLKHVTWKTRRKILVGEWDSLFNRCDASQKGWCTINIRDSFEDAVTRFGALPMLHVRYIREPYVSDLEDYCRITFDRALSYRLAHGSFDLNATDKFLYYDDPVTAMYSGNESPVILEIKTETTIPFWVIRLIQRFNLQQRGFSKYCYALDNCMSNAAVSSRVSAFM